MPGGCWYTPRFQGLRQTLSRGTSVGSVGIAGSVGIVGSVGSVGSGTLYPSARPGM